MRLRLVVAATILALLSLGATPVQKPVRGAFVVLHEPPSEAALTRARDAGLNLVILQYTRSANKRLNKQRVEKLIARFEKVGIDYMLGLHYYEPWEAEWLCRKDLSRHVQSNINLIDALKNKTGSRFKGWYLPLEFANQKFANYDYLAGEFAKIANHTQQPVAIAVYFNPLQPDFDDARTFARNVAKVVEPFDIVLLQDSVGERTISDYDKELKPYYDAVDDAARPEMWAIIEAFKCEGTTSDRQCVEPRTVAAPTRICDQVRVARGFTRDMVAYELMEFLEPNGTTEEQAAFLAFTKAVTGAACP